MRFIQFEMMLPVSFLFCSFIITLQIYRQLNIEFPFIILFKLMTQPDSTSQFETFFR